MPYVREPTNAQQAAAYAFLGVVKTTGGLAVWAAWLSAMTLPWVCHPLRFLTGWLPEKTRSALATLFHAFHCFISVSCAAAVLAATILHSARTHKWFRDLLCEADPLGKAFSDNHLVGAVGAALVFLVWRMLTEPVASAILRSKGEGFVSRFGNATHTGAVWWLIVEHSPLVLLQAFFACLYAASLHARFLAKRHPSFSFYDMLINLVFSSISLIGMIYGGIAYSEQCGAEKSHGSLLVVLHSVRIWTLMREVIRHLIQEREKTA